MVFVPFPRGADDFFYVTAYRHPTEFFAYALGRSDEHGRVACTTCFFYYSEVDLCDFLA